MVKEELTGKNLESASGGRMDPESAIKWLAYEAKRIKHPYIKGSALKYDREYNGGSGQVLDEDSAAFERYKDSWDDYNSTQKLHITHDR